MYDFSFLELLMSNSLNYAEALFLVCGGYNYKYFDSTAVRRPFDCLSKVIKVTVTYRASRSHADLFI